MKMKTFRFVLYSICILVSFGYSESAFTETFSRSSSLNDLAYERFISLGNDEILGNVTITQAVDNKILVGGVNNIYVIDMEEFKSENKGQFINSRQIVSWKPNRKYVDCVMETFARKNCENNIQIISRINQTGVLVCGTGGSLDTGGCRIYNWNGTHLGNYTVLQFNLRKHLVSYDLDSPIVYKFVDGYFYMGYSKTWGLSKDVFLRYSVLESKINSIMFSQPNRFYRETAFAGIAEASDKIYTFFREETQENCDMMINSKKYNNIISRVARVCKNDPGEGQQGQASWTSFYKTRLRCYIPGYNLYYFDEVQQVTDFVDISGHKYVFGVFSNSERTSSAVCGYDEKELNQPFEENSFKNQYRINCFSEESSPKIRKPKNKVSWTSCDGKGISDDDYNYVAEHPIMARTVNEDYQYPIFTKQSSLFSAIAVESNLIMKSGDNITMLYIGTDDGNLLKVAVHQGLLFEAKHKRIPPRIIFSDQQKVFNKDICSPPELYEVNRILHPKILEIKVLEKVLMVVFRHCVIRIPKSQCSAYSCKEFCINSGDPHCGWLDGKCVVKTEKNSKKIQQNFVVSGEELNKCTAVRQQQIARGQNVSYVNCSSSTTIVLSIFLVLTISICVFLIVFLLCREWITKKCNFLGNFKQGRAFEEDEFIGIENKSIDTNRRLKRKQPMRVIFSKNDGEEKGYLGISVEPITSINHKTSIIKKEGVTFSEENITPPKPSAIPLFQNMHKHVDHEDTGSSSNLKYHFGKNTNCNRRSQILDSCDPNDSLVYANTRFSLKGLGSPVLQYYGTVESTQNKSASTYNAITPFFPRDSNDVRFDQSPLKVLVQPDPSFPPLPPCAVLPASAGVVKMASFSGKSTCLQNPPSSVTQDQATSVEQQSLSTSGSADSASSGFISASSAEQQLQQEMNLLNNDAVKRRALMMNKELLSAQTFNLPISPQLLRKAKRLSRQLSGEEMRHSIARSSLYNDSDHTRSSENINNLGDLPMFKNPEFRDSSGDDDEFEEDSFHFQEEGISKKLRRRPLKLFKAKLGGKRTRKGSDSLSAVEDNFITHSIDDDILFTSPSYHNDDDENYIAPKITGWEEIEYTPLGSAIATPVALNNLPRPPKAFADNRGRSFDDINIKSSFAASPTVSGVKDITFLTLRPRSRMRQKLPKMRNTGKEWAFSSSPKPVPTPSLPRNIV